MNFAWMITSVPIFLFRSMRSAHMTNANLLLTCAQSYVW